ncbi:hypothetical protein ACXJJ3_25190 [Kribbella sp. WER1]
MAGGAVALMTVNAHIEPETGVAYTLYNESGRRPWVVLKVGGDGADVNVFVHDLLVLEDLVDALDLARQDLAQALGLLPNGDPCAYADVFGSIEWNEHDHDECLEHLVDEPVPYRTVA